MGCGASKDDFAEPSRTQQVVVRDESPAKCCEAALNLVNTTPDTVEATPCSSLLIDVCSSLPPPTPPQATPALVDPQESPEHVSIESPVLPFSTADKDSTQDSIKRAKSPDLKTQIARLSNGLVGTLASVEEILNARGDVASNAKVTSPNDKEVSYGGILHTLEATMKLQETVEEEQKAVVEGELQLPNDNAEELLPEADTKNEPDADAELPSSCKKTGDEDLVPSDRECENVYMT